MTSSQTSVLKLIEFVNYRGFGNRPARLALDQEFVGVLGLNNSGKSTLLRAFYELKPVFAWLAREASQNVPIYLNAPDVVSASFGPQLARPNGGRITRVDDSAATMRVSLEFDADPNSPTAPRKLTLWFGPNSVMLNRLELANAAGSLTPTTVAVDGEGGGNEIFRGDIAGVSNCVIEWSPVRTALQALARTMYIASTRTTYGGGDEDYYDISVGQRFIRRFDEFKTGSVPEHNEAVHEMTSDLASIFGYDALDISANPEKSGLRVVTNGRSFALEEMGSGLSQFIVLAANVLVNRPSWLLIDEPETNLHGSLQQQLLTLLAGRTEVGVIFGTHSLGLARLADEVLVASRDDASNEARLDSFTTSPNLAATLGAVGHGGFNETSYRGVLLVEGVTDVRTILELRRQLGHRPDLAVISLGGDDLANGQRTAELAEIVGLSPRIFAIVDSERTKAGASPKSARVKFAKDCQDLNIDCLVLERRSIENYFSEHAVQSVYGPTAHGLAAFDATPKGWVKPKNWRVARAMTADDLKGTDLGAFLQKIGNPEPPSMSDGTPS